MKRSIILLGVAVSLIAGVNVLTAQNAIEGVINYEVKVNMHRRLPKEREDMKAMIPEFRTENQQLFFNANESLYKKLEEDTEEQMSSGGGGGMVIRMQAPKLEIHLDNSAQIRTSLQEFMGKDYLIVDTLKVAPWKFGTETKTIAGYECKQAYYTDETRPEQKMEITAWYTDQIRAFLGPERFQTLPGTILAIDVNNGERILVAKSVAFRPLKKKEMSKPSSGIKTTQAAFRTMVDEQMKKMGGSGGIMIRN